MNGQGNMQETRLAELTLAILFLNKLKEAYQEWDLPPHQIENTLEDLNRERNIILKREGR